MDREILNEVLHFYLIPFRVHCAIKETNKRLYLVVGNPTSTRYQKAINAIKINHNPQTHFTPTLSLIKRSPQLVVRRYLLLGRWDRATKRNPHTPYN